MLDLVSIYLSERQDLLRWLKAALEARFAMDVRLRTPAFDPEASYNSSRGQYSSTGLLRQLLEDGSLQGDRVLGVTTVDLCTPVLTYVFGEAQLDGRAAVVSIHRLRAEAYGLPADDALLLDRLDKEATHELGHTFGLVHCLDPTCVMHASTYAEEIDFKGAEFCMQCLAVVREAARRVRA